MQFIKNLINKIQENIIYKVIMIFYKKFLYFDTFGIAAQVAYYFIFSIFPIVLLLISILPLLNIDPLLITVELQGYIPGVLTGTLDTIITNLLSVSNGYVITGAAILTLWSGSAMANCLIKSINRINDGRITRNYFIGRGLSVLLTFFFLVVVVISIITVAVSNDFFTNLFPIRIQVIINLVKDLFIPAILGLLLFAIYYIGPAKKQELKFVLPGTIFALVGFLLLNFGFNYYINHFTTYDIRYGALGAVIVFMLWTYSIGLLIMTGAILNSTIQDVLYYVLHDEPNTVMMNYTDEKDFWDNELEKKAVRDMIHNRRKNDDEDMDLT